jgi:hypothetical protein
MKTFLLSAFCLLVCTCSMGQQSTLDIVGIHQLVDESLSEHHLQVDARSRQAVVAGSEQANTSLLAKMKNTYRSLQQRYNSLAAVISIAGIGTDALPMTKKIASNQGQIMSLVQSDPALAPLAYRTEIEFAQKAKSLLAYALGLSLSLGEVNQMKASDRKILFDYVTSELSRVQELSGNLVNLLRNFRQASFLRAPGPFSDFLDRDKSLAEHILQNVKYLK